MDGAIRRALTSGAVALVIYAVIALIGGHGASGAIGAGIVLGHRPTAVGV